VAYILSAVLGVILIAVVVWLFTRVVTVGKPAPASSKQ